MKCPKCGELMHVESDIENNRSAQYLVCGCGYEELIEDEEYQEYLAAQERPDEKSEDW